MLSTSAVSGGHKLYRVETFVEIYERMAKQKANVDNLNIA